MVARRAAFAVLLLLLAGRARAQVNVNAEVDKTSVALDDQIVLNVTVSGPNASLPEPQIPQMPHFSVYSRGRSQSLSFINGQVESSTVHTFVLVPRSPGRGMIPAISVDAGGEAAASTTPIEIVVEGPGAQPSPRAAAAPGRPGAAHSQGAQGPEMFLVAELDKPRAFVDEQVVVTIRFHTAVGLLGNPQYSPPKLTGFLVEDLPPERHGRVNARGRQYYYSEIRTALFPQQAGRLSIGAAGVRVQVRDQAAVDPFSPDFFDRFFSQGMGGARTRDLSSEPLLLMVEKLPEAGKPAGFSGAVGRYAVSASLDRAQVKAGEAVTLTVTIKGVGNLKTVAAPPLPALEGFRVFDTVASLNLDKKDGRVEGSKVFKTVLVPRVSGELTIPALAFSYFDPQKRAYAAAQTMPIRMKIAPGDASSAVGFAAPSAEAARGLSSVSQDVRYLKPALQRRPLSRALESFANAGPIHAVPLAVCLLALAAAWKRKQDESDPAKRKRRLALKTALARLEQGAAPEALQGYLADALNKPAAGLTARKAQESLRAARPGIDEAALAELRAVWDELDRLRFAPSGAQDAPAAAARVASLLQRLEGALS